MEIIEQIGSYAGFAALLGLAVLSALYFSQARDVRRLREWAGRAPDRGRGPGLPPQRVVGPVPLPPGAQPTHGPARPPPGPPPGAPTGPSPARAVASGAAPASAPGPSAATPAAARAAHAGAGLTKERGEGGGVSHDTVVHPPPAAAREDEVLEGDELEGDRFPDDELEGDRLADDEPEGEELEGGELQGDELDRDELEGHEGEELERDELQGEELGEGPPEDEHRYRVSPLEAHVDDLEDEDHDREREESEPQPAARVAPPPSSGRTDPRPMPPLPPSTSAIPRRVPPPPRTPPATPAGARPRPYEAGVRPPFAGSRPDAVDRSEGVFSSPGRVALLICAAVIGLAAATYGGLQLGDGEDEAREPATGQGGGAAEPVRGTAGAGERKRSPVDPADVTVSVLNGTTVQGLAAEVGDRVEQQRFQLGTVSNFTDQERAESVVLYAAGAEGEAAEVGRRLKIAQREPIDPGSQAQAGDATVVVVVGADKSE